MKIHFLEDLLNKSDPNLNQNALKENTDLRVDRATLQRELAKVKKQLNSSAHDAESLRQQMLDSKARSEKELTDKRLQHDLRTLQAELQVKEEEIERLRDTVASGEKREEMEELRDTIEDLEATVREKERIIESNEDRDVRIDHFVMKGVCH